ncbi:sigma-54 interaction domain-containing protein [Methylomagnum ishizawai]|uniref:sigma-54 interaction domain-containing protein n=1 Tax=Methylomagnum ishizawai TaxID=1760988 RepID=UPI001C322AC9|nr:sigma 54-interacting transcriptional regulator [Methylomagnum ishizawai]BBL73006.1 transcriptional regulator [Methylomagnum ishizawai]
MHLLAFPNPSELSLSVRASALVFEDPKSRELLARIELVGPSELNALIIGETGTGKELVARHIHQLSPRKQGPFLAVNCAALSENLIESELFGHEKGAFTGAVSTKQGWFEAAAGGTLFLDEIGDLPQPMQVKLLRVLQEREVVRVGSHKPIPIDVRLVAATNVKLEEAVLAGRFREDLYYRLNVAALHLPPLRQRPGDILPLAHHFLRFYGHRLGCPETALSPAAEQAILGHGWPGNIRELENALHHALLVARDRTIVPGDLNLSPMRVRALPQEEREPGFEDLERLLEALCAQGEPDLYGRVEKILFAAAYRQCQRNQLATARLLGISRHVARAKLIQHGLLSLAGGLGGRVEKPEPLAAPSGLFPAHRPLAATAPPDRPVADAAADWWGF